MAATLNGESLFDSQHLAIEIGSFTRDSIEKAIAGLDGIVSFDLGGRARIIKQKGTLRAASKKALQEKVGAIGDYLDGYAYTLVTDDSSIYENLRMDVFKLRNERTEGRGVALDYEIIYTQLTAK